MPRPALRPLVFRRRWVNGGATAEAGAVPQFGHSPVTSWRAASRSTPTEPNANRARAAAGVLPAGSPGSSMGVDNDVTTEVILCLVVLRRCKSLRKQ